MSQKNVTGQTPRISDTSIWEVGLGPTPQISASVKRMKSRVGLGPTLDFIRMSHTPIWGVGAGPALRDSPHCSWIATIYEVGALQSI